MMIADTLLTHRLSTQSLAARQPSAAARLTERRSDASPTEQRSAAIEFEQFFIAQMLEHMFAGISTDSPFGGGNGESIFRSLLNTEYAGIISRAGGIGIADAVHKEILKLQESETS